MEKYETANRRMIMNHIAPYLLAGTFFIGTIGGIKTLLIDENYEKSVPLSLVEETVVKENGEVVNKPTEMIETKMIETKNLFAISMRPSEESDVIISLYNNYKDENGENIYTELKSTQSSGSDTFDELYDYLYMEQKNHGEYSDLKSYISYENVEKSVVDAMDVKYVIKIITPSDKTIVKNVVGGETKQGSFLLIVYEMGLLIIILGGMHRAIAKKRQLTNNYSTKYESDFDTNLTEKKLLLKKYYDDHKTY